MTNTYLLFLLPILLFSNNIFAQQKNHLDEASVKKKAEIILQQTKGVYGLEDSDITDFIITHQHISKQSGVHHVYIRQQLNGLEIIGAEAGLHISPNNKLLTSDINFIKNIKDKSALPKSPTLTAVEAVQAAADQMGYKIKTPFKLLSNKNNGNNKLLISKGGISLKNIPAKLVYQNINGNDITLAWDISIQELNEESWWSMRVDARTGKIINKYNQVLKCSFENSCGHDGHQEEKEEGLESRITEHWQENGPVSPFGGGWGEERRRHILPPAPSKGGDRAVPLLAPFGPTSYRVYPLPLQSPHYGGRELVINPADPTASPFGWHDTDGVLGAEYNITRGNNAHAFENGDHIGFSPDGGAALNFDFPINETYSNEEQSEAAVTTNLFYWSNVVHDLFYQYGFDEASGNFQVNNYGNGGAGNDHVRALSQRGLRCNAFMSTPGDGFSPILRMFVGTCGPVKHDGSIDNAVIVHEYGHGISIRLTGGGGNSACLFNEEQMGEGWSDWFAMMLTMQQGDGPTDRRTLANWLFGKPITGSGIRPYPYTTDLAVNPHTYDHIKTAGRPHGIGVIWTAMLWEVSWALIDRYGFDPDFYHGTGGNNMALALVTEGLKLQPCSPGFVDGRDAILAADVALFGGANKCLIWEAFAKRGLGYSADQGSSFDKTDGAEAFDLPPVSTCADITVLLDNDGQYELSQPDLNMLGGLGSDNSGNLTFTAVPASFSCADLGENTVTLTAGDICGNSNVCEAKVNVVALPESLEIEVRQESCGSAGDGKITILTVAACGQTSYSVDGGSNVNFTGVFENLPPGEYPVFVKISGVPETFELAETITVQAGATPDTWYKDADGDGYTDGLTVESCDPVTGYLLEALAGDCNDYDADHFPGQTWYKDADGDGYTDAQILIACSPPPGGEYKLGTELTSMEVDCDESDPAINPGAAEICNGKDDNCDGAIDEDLIGEIYYGNVFFTTQAQLDEWPACYSSVNGSVTISGVDITDLSTLSNLTSITGSLTVFSNFLLASLNGLDNLTSIGGSLMVYYNFQLSDCCAIHDLLNGEVIFKLIFFNKTGCNSELEVNAACGSSNLIAPSGEVLKDISYLPANAILERSKPLNSSYGTALSPPLEGVGGRNYTKSIERVLPPTPSKGGDRAVPFQGLSVASLSGGISTILFSNIDAQKSMQLFPNPTSGLVTLKLYGSFKTGRLQVFDWTGRLVFFQNFTEGSPQKQLLLKEWGRGMYLVKVQLDGESFTQKVVVK